MHPLVRDLYKRVVWVGRDYPTGWPHVQALWKKALRNPDNCPLWYSQNTSQTVTNAMEEELLRAVHKGRWAVKEMIGVIQLKKYRSLQQSYNRHDSPSESILQQYLHESNITSESTAVPR